MREFEPTEDEWELVKVRIEALPSNVRISIGGIGLLKKEDMVTHIEKHDEIGKLLAKIQLNYIRSFKQEVAAIHGD